MIRGVTRWYQKALDFLQLVQGSMTVAQYEAKFTSLSRYAPYLISTEPAKAKKFENGLRMNIRSQVSILKLQTYDEVVDRAAIAKRDCEESKKKQD